MDRPLRFCMFTTFYPPYSFGGDAVYVQQLANELAKRGHHVEIVHCLDSYRLLANGDSLRTSADHPNLIVHRLESGFGPLSPLATQQTGYPHFKSRQINNILAPGFDVLHYHNISLVGGPKLLERGKGIKLYSTHEYWLVCPTNVLFRYDGVACEETRCFRCTVAYHRPPQLWRYTNMMKNALSNLDMILHPSQFSLNKHREMGLSSAATVLPYFHAPPETVSNVEPINGKDPYFLYVGRLEPLKGPHTLVPFFRDYPRARLVVVGEGSQLQELKVMAHASPNIEFLGWLDHSQIVSLYRNATAILIPSLCYEAGPLVPIEGFLYSTPSIGRRLGTLPELLEGTGAGLTYSDDESLRAALDELLDNPGRRNEMGARGRAAYCKTYTPEAHLTRYFEIIDQLDRAKNRLN